MWEWVVICWLGACAAFAWMVSRWHRFMRGDFDVVPRIEDLADLVGDGDYVQACGWSVFEDLEGDERVREVLIVMGDRWTILKGDEFRRMAMRILPQL